MTSQRISIIMPVKNDQVHAERALASIRRYAPRETEVVLIDNDSDDVDAGRIKPLVDVYLRTPGSVGQCRRVGVKASSGDVLFFMDADQELTAGTIESALESLTRYGAVVVPEQPRSLETLFFKVLAAERTWAEWLGLGAPRVMRRSTYLSTGGHSDSLAFAEDRFVDPERFSVGTSQVPIYHSEVRSLRALTRKYYRYGSQAANNVDALIAATRRGLARYSGHGARPSVSAALLLPLALALKCVKSAAFLLGLATARRRQGTTASFRSAAARQDHRET